MTGEVFLLSQVFLMFDAGLTMLTSGNQSDEQRLLSDLFRHYDPAARPIANMQNYTGSVQQVTVTLLLLLTKMDGIDPKKQTLTVSGWMAAEWADERLSWKPDDYGGIEKVFIPPSSVWLPDFYLENSASETQYDEDHYRWFLTSLTSDGEISWIPGGNLKSKCNIDVTLFPFDEQVCELIVTNYMYSGDYVNLTYINAENLLEVYSENGEWNIHNTSVWRTDFYFYGKPYPKVHYVLHLKRKPLYFTVNIIIPSVLLSGLVLVVFKLPPDSGEKIAMGVTILLSYSVFILMISENIPETSNAVPIIVIYLITFMATTCISVAMSVFVLDLHHRDGLQRPGHGLKVAMLGLARILRLNIRHLELQKGANGNQIVENATRHLPVTSGEKQSGANNNQTSGSDGDNKGVRSTDLEFQSRGITHATNMISHENPALGQIVRILQRHERRIISDTQKNAARDEWKEIATVVDRLCLWISLVILILVTPIMLVLWPYVATKPQL